MATVSSEQTGTLVHRPRLSPIHVTSLSLWDVPQECASEYQEMVADKCLHCQKGVRKAGEFSGSFYPVDRKLGDAEGEDNESKVHMECFEAYQAKLAEEVKGS